MTREDLLNRTRSLKAVPTLSGVVEKVSGLLADKNSSFDSLSKIMQYDLALTSKIIGIANSAWYNRGVGIVTLQRAMTAIGLEEVKRLLTCIMVYEGIFSSLKLRDEDLASIWKHSLYVACASKMLALRTGKQDPERVFTVALLHDIGMVPFFMFDPRYRDIVRVSRLKKQSLCDMEEDMFGIDHQELGFYISAEWKLPDEFRKVIRYHHLAERVDGSDEITRFVTSADRFSYFPESADDSYLAILFDEKQRIEAEVDRITDILFAA